MPRFVALLLALGLAVPFAGSAVAEPAQVTVEGTVRTASGTPVRGAAVSLETLSGDPVATTVTGDGGPFRLRVPPGPVRLVVGSGAYRRADAGLPARFRWQVPLVIDGDLTLPVVLPRAHPVDVAATTPDGRPLPGAGVRTASRPVRPAPLWAGGPPAEGRQSPAPGPLVTGFTGRATFWAFPTGDLRTHVDRSSVGGVLSRATLTTAVDAQALVVAAPGHPGCAPRVAADLGRGPVRLVADLDDVVVGESTSRAALLRTADDVVAGRIPAVRYNAERSGDPERYLYDEAVALRRIAGVLAYAYAATGDRVYLRTMARSVALSAARWPDWNPGHPLDTVHLATAVALAYGWSRAELAPGERAEVVDALLTRAVLPYACDGGRLAGYRERTGNQTTVVATAAALAGIAVRNDLSAWGSVSFGDATSSLARFRAPEAAGRSLAGGPTVEGLMYTSYEATHLALLHATRRRHQDDPPVAAALAAALPELGVLADWHERCGSPVEADMEDSWDVYPWVDRPTALAAMTAWPVAGGGVRALFEALQARDTLTVPEQGTWPVPDGIAELIISEHPAPSASRPPAVQSFAPREGSAAAYWGCATHGPMRAVLSAAPNDAPHAHHDVGNVVVSHGGQEVLADLGQRDYAFSGTHEWRRLTKSHNTLGLRLEDGRVVQSGAAWGSVSAPGDGLRMDSPGALEGADWSRDVRVTEDAVTVRDRVTARAPGPPRPLSMSFLLPTPRDQVTDLGDGRVRFALADGSTWELVAPPGVVSVSDAQPTPPYADTAVFAETLGSQHSLVVVETSLLDRLDLTTTVRQVAPAA
ncbi:MAG TPA: carboxypeptidase regulatory-like domain-containing protein [Actinomycetes bacterium]|nr:carboxypeptidase regulatory-like domain-containing protein [Actinomycetes bacterium]